MVFFGEYAVSFSAPGRIIVPKKIRELLTGDSFVLTRGHGSCLAGYNRQDWEGRANELVNVSLLDTTDMQKRRLVFASASIVEIDDQGRFVIPKSLMGVAGTDSKAVIIGVGDHFEIWSESAWKSEFSSYQL